MRRIVLTSLAAFAAVAAHGAASVTPWVPIFQGIEQASGRNDAATSGSLSAYALRIDLQDPDVRLFTTPPVTNNYVPNDRETLFQTPAEFLREYQLQVAVNSVNFSPSGYNNQSGQKANLSGLVISEGRFVSSQNQFETNISASAMLFSSNKEPSFVFFNWPQVDTNGVYHAVAGMFPLLRDGVNISYAYTNEPGTIHDNQPRTAFGLSEDNRYLFLVTIDGRTGGTQGALDWETAEFLLLFGAWHGMNVDGGGSTCMVKADDCGEPVDINSNSYQVAVGRPGAQRPVGCNFGASAKPLLKPIREVTIEPAPTTALITWKTEMPATTQVDYGLTTNYGSATPLDSRLTRSHVATLTGLNSGSTYYFRARSSTGAEEHTFACRLSTPSTAANRTLVFDVTKSWRYTTNNLDGVNWKAPGYSDAGWMGEGPGLLYVLENSAQVSPRNTVMPPLVGGAGVTIPRTYYFRTHFDFFGSPAGLSLMLSNYVDDGAVFYLNGAEIYRLRMQAAPTVITYGSIPNGLPCTGPNLQQGDAAMNCPDVFTITGAAMSNLVQGDNVLAVEVHNNSGVDLVFGSALLTLSATLTPPQLNLWTESDIATLFWNGEGFSLQQSSDLGSVSNWSDIAGGMQSPVTVTNSTSTFYRLRN